MFEISSEAKNIIFKAQLNHESPEQYNCKFNLPCFAGFTCCIADLMCGSASFISGICFIVGYCCTDCCIDACDLNSRHVIFCANKNSNNSNAPITPVVVQPNNLPHDTDYLHLE